MGMPQKKTRTALDGDLSAAYLFTPSVGVGPYIPFLLIPSEGQHFIIGDVGVKGFNKKVINARGFTLGVNLALQLPTSTFSSGRHMKYAIKSTPNVRYIIPHSNFRVGAWTEAKSYVGVDRGNRAFKLWAAPYVNYSLNDNFSLNLQYAIEAHHYAGKPNGDFMLYQTDLEPGVVWNINKKIMINPYLQIFTGNKITWENTALGAVMSASL
jgi:hypothetical protein